MATRAKKPTFDIKNVLFAAAGGAAAGSITGLLENNIGYFQANPKMTPAAIGALSAAGLYFMDSEYHPLFYGMLGASAGDLADQFVSTAKGGQMKSIEIDESDLQELMPPAEISAGDEMLEIFEQLDKVA
jgi:hypothetical protein